jgi:hypothetical protein
MLLKSIALFGTGALLLTGCSIGLPNPADAEACEKLSAVLTAKIENVATGGLNAPALSESIKTEVLPVAPEGLQPNITRVVDALAADPVAAGEVTAAGSEIAIRCALVGVNLEFPNPADLIAG